MRKARGATIIYGLLIAAGFGLLLTARPPAPRGRERVRTDAAGTSLVAVRDGTFYCRKWGDSAITRAGAGSSAPTRVAFQPVQGTREFVAADDGLYALDSQVVTDWRQRQYRKEGKITLPFAHALGSFRLSSPRPGEQRETQTRIDRLPPNKIVGQFLPWGGSTAEQITLPAPSEGEYAIKAVAPHGFYLALNRSDTSVRVRNAAGVRWEYPANVALVRVPLRGGTPQVITRDLTAVSGVIAAHDAICWSNPRAYPDTGRDIICRAVQPGASSVMGRAEVVRNAASGYDSSLERSHGYTWWLQPEPPTQAERDRALHNQTGPPPTLQLYETAPSGKPRRIDPPLRQSEDETIRHRWLRWHRNRLYLRCDVEPAAGVGVNESPQEFARRFRYCLLRLYPEHAGTPAFWGKPVLLDSEVRSEVLGDSYLYFSRLENDPSLSAALRDMLSTQATDRERNTLYRVPLPP